MKRFFLCLLISTAVLPCFSMGIGPVINGNQKITYNEDYSVAFGASLSIKPDSLPFYFGFATNYDPFKSSFQMNLSADFYICNPELAPNWNFFIGAGAGTGADIYSDRVILNFGPRIFTGMSWFMLDGFLEIFFQQAAQQNVSFEVGGDGRTFYPLELPFSIGVRIWD